VVVRSHLVGADFLLNWPDRVIQTDEVVTKIELPAFYKPLVASFLQTSGGQLSADWGRCSIELAPFRKISDGSYKLPSITSCRLAQADVLPPALQRVANLSCTVPRHSSKAQPPG